MNSQNSYSTPKTDAVAFRIGGKMETAPHRVEYRSEEVVPAERMRELECELAEVLKRAATAEARLVERPTPEHNEQAVKQIVEHNFGCKSSCEAQRPTSDERIGCGYQRKDGSLIYAHRRCPECPMDWRIEWPVGSGEFATHGSSS